MNKNPIHVGTTLGPYTPGLEIPCANSKILFVSGQIPIDQNTGEIISADFEKQARQVFANLSALLEKGGYNLKDVVKLTIFLTDLQNFSVVNEVCKEYLREPFPARSTVQISALPKGALLEIEAVALKNI